LPNIREKQKSPFQMPSQRFGILGLTPLKLSLAMLLSIALASVVKGQEGKTISLSVRPPKILVFVHQELQPGRDRELERLETNMSSACYRLGAPSFWLNLRSLSGYRESLALSPFDSFEHWEQSREEWKDFYSSHADVSKLHEEIDQQVGNERTVVAVRRPDLGYRSDDIDLSQTRFLRTIEVRLFPGRQSEFIEGIKLLADAHAKVQASTPWEVYELNAGMASPTFVIFTPLPTMSKNDDLLSTEEALATDEGGEVNEQLGGIARETYASAETMLYDIRHERSYITKEFAEGDPGFWRAVGSAEAQASKRRKFYSKAPQSGSR
jgi:hypothetical protein